MLTVFPLTDLSLLSRLKSFVGEVKGKLEAVVHADSLSLALCFFFLVLVTPDLHTYLSHPCRT